MDRITPQHWIIGLIPTMHHTRWGPERYSTPKPPHDPTMDHGTQPLLPHATPGPPSCACRPRTTPPVPQKAHSGDWARFVRRTPVQDTESLNIVHTLSAASPPPLERGLLSSSEVAQTKSTPVFVNTNHANERAGEPAGPRAAVTWYGCSPALPSPSCTCQRQSLYRPLRARTRE